MNLLKRLYTKLTDPIRADIEKHRKSEENRILERYRKSCHGQHKSKWDYSVMCKTMMRNNQSHELLLQKKLAKWEWLKKLV